jgi:hypothetical protein
MYPKSLQLIKYKGLYLGTSKNVFGFVKPAHVKTLIKQIKYENIRITSTLDNSFILKPQHIKKPLNKHLLKTSSFDPSVGSYFAEINNMNIAIIDDISYNVTDESFQLYSNYTIDFDIDDDVRRYQLDLIFEGAKIDYDEEYNNMLMLSLLDFNEED